MILVYVAGPFSAPTRAGVEANIARAVAVGLEVARIGLYPIIPHANTAHPDFEKIQPYTFWIGATMAMLKPCRAMVLVPGWETSSGARSENAWMVERCRPVFASVKDLDLWAKKQQAEIY